jgi:apolipoprotein N-acyltransferase
MLIRDDRMYNVACFIAGGEVSYHAKLHLVPYGEFLPGRRFRAVRAVYRRASPMIPETTPGSEYTLFPLGGAKFAALICFENLFPELAAEYAARGAEFFVTLTNDSWYGDSPGPRQHFAHNAFRAIETGRYVIQVATSGVTGIVSPDGRVTLLEENGRNVCTAGVLRGTVTPLRTRTVYGILGDLPLMLALLLLTGGVLCRK